jgi:membrane fusion protein, multidrug efflux system
MAGSPQFTLLSPRFSISCLVSLGGLAALAGCSAHATPQENPAAMVRVALAARGPQALTLNGLGHVEGFYTASARAQTSGEILAVSFKEGDTVHAGQALAQIDPRPLQAVVAQDNAALARDRAALAAANDMLSRNAPLVAQGLASAQQVVGYRSQVNQLTAALAGDRAAIARDRLTLGYTIIRAPIAGVTGVRQIDPGNIVGPTDPTGVVTVAQIQPIAVTFTLPQSTITQIRTAMAAAGTEGLVVDALAQSNGRVLDHGHLTVIDNRIDNASGTVTLKAVFPNAQRLLWPGELVNARITLGSDANAVTVPASALQSNPQGAYVWVVAPNNRASMRTVVTGPRLGDRVIISSGLSGGERVATDGQFGLAPGARVQIAGGTAAPQPLKNDDPERLGLRP